MDNFDYNEIDDVIHSRIRTAIMAVLTVVEEADFSFLKNKINATDGNLSVHLKKLEEAKYITSKKMFIERKPVSKYKITKSGLKAFENYVNKLGSLIKK